MSPHLKYRISTHLREFRTKGYIHIKAQTWERGVNLSTLYDSFDGDILASETDTPLQVRLNLEKAQTVDSDIEILVSGSLQYSIGT